MTAPTAPGRSGLGRTVGTSSGIGFVLTVIIVTAAVAASGGGVASIGAGVMVGGFSGIPFGAMLGTMVFFMRNPEH